MYDTLLLATNMINPKNVTLVKLYLHIDIVMYIDNCMLNYKTDLTIFGLNYKSNYIYDSLAPPAGRQRSFFNDDSSVVRRRPSSTFHLKC